MKNILTILILLSSFVGFAEQDGLIRQSQIRGLEDSILNLKSEIQAASHNPVTLGTANGLSLSTQELSLGLSSTSTNGALSSTDWNTFNGKQAAYTNLTTFGSLANSTGWLYNNGSGVFNYSTPTKSDVGLGNVENTALSTWAGSTNLTTLGTIATGTWNGTAIGDIYLTKTGDWTGTFDGQEGSYYLNRSNHTGTQAANTISDFDTEVSNNVDVAANSDKRESDYNVGFTGLINGSNNSYTLDTNFKTGKTAVYLNGLRQKLGTHYSESGNNIILFTTAPSSGDDLIFDIIKQ